MPSSSLSEPAVVAEFMELLDLQDRNNVLEIGTGSGWTAALLSQRLGGDRVTTVEVDQQVADTARANLAVAGYQPAVITGDGAAGWPARAPYDRVHVTCGVARIPGTWIEQCRPGAVIVLPWLPAGYGGHQVRLRAGRDGRAIGRFHGGCGFMMMRSQRSRWNAHHRDQARTCTGLIDPREIDGAGPGLHLVMAALLPGVTQLAMRDSDGSFSLLLFENAGEDGCWAAADSLPSTPDVQVTQYGDRSLWEEAEAAFGDWLRLGAPSADRFGLTVDRSGQQVWLDSPDHVISPA